MFEQSDEKCNSVNVDKSKQKNSKNTKTNTNTSVNVEIVPLKQNATVIPPDVERNVKEFSRCTALYTMLILSLGTMRDSGQLRDDINTIRQRGWELANHNKSLLVPRMKQTTEDGTIAYKDLERVFFMFCSCLEFFMEQLLRTVDLLGSFHLNSGGHPEMGLFVSSGLSDQMPGCLYLRAAASSISASPLSSPVPSTARRHSAFNFRFNAPKLKTHSKQHALLTEKGGSRAEGGQEVLLKKDIKALKDLILEIHSSIALTPWTIQPQYHLDRFAGNTDSLASLVDSSEDEGGIDSVRSSTCKFSQGLETKDKESQTNTTQRRCIFLTIIILVSVVLFAIALGVCIRLLT